MGLEFGEIRVLPITGLFGETLYPGLRCMGTYGARLFDPYFSPEMRGFGTFAPGET